MLSKHKEAISTQGNIVKLYNKNELKARGKIKWGGMALI